MSTLASPPYSCSRIVADRFGNRAFLCSLRESNCHLNIDARFFPSKKFAKSGFLHLICAKKKALHPVSASSSSSSLSSESQFQLVELETVETQNQATDQSKTVRVKFQLQKQCSFGEEFGIVGDDPMLGLWDPESSLPLNWSDGHVWTAELDLPIGKSIEFKFILKGITGKVLWQPGPNRVLQTWETANTIAVFEDWENADIQKITEAELVANKNEDSSVNSEVLIVAENMTELKDEMVSDVNKAIAVADANPNTGKEPLEKVEELPIVTDNIAPPQEKPKTIIADNISHQTGDPVMNANDEVHVEKRISHGKVEPEVNSNEETVVEDGIGSNGRTPAVNSSSAGVEGNLITYEADPVLVPGLAPLPVISNEASTHDIGERSVAFDASLGVNEVKNHDETELDEKLEIDGRTHQEETTQVVNGEEQLHSKLIQEPVTGEEGQNESQPLENGVLGNDIQWGRKTIQKLLANLGLM